MTIHATAKKIIYALILLLTVAVSAAAADSKKEHRPWVRKQITADHSKFEQLKRPFQSGDEITKACLECHNRADEQLRSTQHWQWHLAGNEALGKGGLVVNNYCISTNKLGDNSCLDCHIGWNATKGQVNCLVCHSQKEMNWKEAFEDIGEFQKAGDAESQELIQYIREDLHESVTSIGQPTAKNCGSCHFYSGGGDGVKRGDLDTSLINPSRDLDVHLSKDGAGLTCIDCHNTKNHQVPGREYTMSAKEMRHDLGEREFQSFLRCESCHSKTPHHDQRLNDHFKVIACQTCHIPSLAREHPTKVWWDWSKAGQKKDGKPFHTTDEFGMKNYMSIKGEFIWAKNVLPTYAWFDGSMKNFLLTDTIPDDRSKPIVLQEPNGSPKKKGNKIHPFKIHRGKQPYDTELQHLLAPLLSGDEGYWNLMDWQVSLARGQELLGLPYSGKYDFIETSFMYPVSHMVAPKEKALQCDACHHRAGDGDGSRMANVPGVYVPGRGDLLSVTKVAWALLALVVLGAIFHGVFRIVVKVRKKPE